MTPSGVIEIPLLLMQLGTGALAAAAGVRIVDDVRTWLDRRQTRDAS